MLVMCVRLKGRTKIGLMDAWLRNPRDVAAADLDTLADAVRRSS
jgi:hypothetical protein